MSKQRWGRDELIRFTLFLVLIALGWIGLSWAGYTENPVESMRSLVEVYQILQLNPSTILPDSSGSVGLFTDFDWSAFPDVLYDIWFICLITAVVILINRLVVHLTKYLKTNR
jgi:hypothetical protein